MMDAKVISRSVASAFYVARRVQLSRIGKMIAASSLAGNLSVEQRPETLYFCTTSGLPIIRPGIGVEFWRWRRVLYIPRWSAC